MQLFKKEKTKPVYNFLEFNSIYAIFKDIYQQVLGKKVPSHLQRTIENMPEGRKQELKFMKITVDFMLLQLKQQFQDDPEEEMEKKLVNDTNRKKGFTLVYSGLCAAVEKLARGENYSNTSEFGDQLGETNGTIRYDKKSQKMKVPMTPVQLVQCLTAAEDFMKFILYKDSKYENGLYDTNMYSQGGCDYKKEFGALKVMDKIQDMLKKAKFEVSKNAEKSQKERREIEEPKEKKSYVETYLGWFISSKKSNDNIIVQVTDEFVDEQALNYMQSNQNSTGYGSSSY